MVASGFHMVLHRLQSLTVYDPLRGLEVTEVLFASWREAFHPSKRTVIQLESESEKKRQIYLGIKSPPFLAKNVNKKLQKKKLGIFNILSILRKT